MTRSLLWRLVLIALLALGVRLAYQAGMVAFGGDFNNGSDSAKYLNVAHTILDTGQFAATDAKGNLESASNRLPLYLYFLAAVFKLANGENLRLVVTIQALFDAFSVFAIGLAARAISGRLVVPAAVMAALIPNFIVQSSYILQESLFLVFFTWGLCAILWAVRAERPLRLLITAGLLLGLSLVTRLAMVYYGVFLVPALFYALAYRRQVAWVRAAALAVVPVLGMFVVASPLMIHNYLTYGYAALSSQNGSHLLNWFYGCMAGPTPCADRVQILARLNELQTAELQRGGATATNPFAFSAFQSHLAIEKLLQLPILHIASSMTLGILKTLVQSGFYEVFSQYNQPLTFFSTVKGSGIAERLWNFVEINRTNAFMWMWAVSEILELVSRLLQFYGLYLGIRSARMRPYTALLFATTAYFILIVGPVASPRYRIPAEPTLILLSAIGFVGVLDRYRSRRSRSSAEVQAATA